MLNDAMRAMVLNRMRPNGIPGQPQGMPSGQPIMQPNPSLQAPSMQNPMMQPNRPELGNMGSGGAMAPSQSMIQAMLQKRLQMGMGNPNGGMNGGPQVQ